MNSSMIMIKTVSSKAILWNGDVKDKDKNLIRL